MATEQLVVRRHVRFSSGERGRRKLRAAVPATPPPAAAIPRISRLMALAVCLNEMVRSGQVSSYHELASLCRVSPSRMCQVMALLDLAPSIEEELLFLPPGSPTVTERSLRDLLTATDWDEQRTAWQRLSS